MSDLKEQIESSFDRLALVLNERRKELLDSLYSEEQTSCSTNNDDKQITFTLDLEGLERTLRSIGELTRTGFVASRCSLKWQRTTEFVLQLRDSAGNPFSLPSSESDFRSLVDLYLVEEKKKSRLNFKIRNQDTSQGSYVIHFTPPHKGCFLVDVTVKGLSIPGSPFRVDVPSRRSHYLSLQSRSYSIGSLGLCPSDGQFQCPRGVCLDSRSSLLYVADEDFSSIFIFSTKESGEGSGPGSLLSFIKLDTSPHCLALFPPSSTSSSAASFLMATCGDDSVRIYQVPEGQLIRHIQLQAYESSSSISTAFKNPWGVFIEPADKEEEVKGEGLYRVHIADTSNHRVVIFLCSPHRASSDRVLRVLGTRKGSEEGELMAPVAVCCDSEGEVFVVENGNSRVSQFSSKTGEFRRKSFWEPGKFESPWGIALDCRSKRKEEEEGEGEVLLVCDWGNNQLVVLDKKTGDVITRVIPKKPEELVSPFFVAIGGEDDGDVDRNIFVTDSNGVQVF